MESAVIAAIGRTEIASYIGALFTVYMVLILLNVLLSWIPRIPYSRPVYAVVDFVKSTTDPYLRLFRRIIPPIGGIGLDLSPILALIVLGIVRGLVVGAVEPG